MPDTRRVVIVLRLDPPSHRDRQLLRGIRRFADAHPHWHCTLTPDLPAALAGRVHGVLAPTHAATWAACRRAAIPMVGMGHVGTVHRMPRVGESMHQAGSLAARHLDGHHYPHFAFLGIHQHNLSGQLERGYTHTVHTIGSGIRTMVIPRSHRNTAKRRRRFPLALDRWLGKLPLPVGILVADDLMARQLADCCLARGLHVPRDVGIVSVGNDPALCTFPQPPLTAIDYDYPRMGHAAARLLEALMAGGPPPSRDLKIAPFLAVRRSTDRRRDEDPRVHQALTYIAQYAALNITAHDIARHIGVSRRKLDQLFRNARRPTVTTEIRRARLRRACHLLATTDEPIEAVATLAGYRNGPALYKVFRRDLRTTPTAYRKRKTEPEETRDS